VTARQDLSILIVGERTNTNGSKKFKEAIIAEDIDTCAAIGREQVKEGSHVVDVCVDYVGRDGVPDMTKVVQRFAKDVTGAADDRFDAVGCGGGGVEGRAGEVHRQFDQPGGWGGEVGEDVLSAEAVWRGRRRGDD